MALTARDLAKRFQSRDRTVDALRSVNLEIPENSFTAIIGPSGCGKSTLLNLFAGLETPDQGRIEVPVLPGETRLGRIALMPQSSALLPWRSVLDNAALGLELDGVPRAERHRQVRDLLPRFGLEGREQAWPRQLSSGMQQRVALLRTFLPQRPLYLLDEPFGRLDSLTRLSLQEWLLAYWQETRPTVILITHQIEEAILLADTIYVMQANPGGIRQRLQVEIERPRDPERILDDPRFQDLRHSLLRALRPEISEPHGT